MNNQIEVPHVFSSNNKELDVFRYAEDHGVEEIHIKVDKDINLYATIAIHNTGRGPALGGCRCVPYASSNAAIMDAVRLSRAMSYKSAICDLPFGGGKAVIMKPPIIADREAFYRAIATFVNELSGRFITGEDSGTFLSDVDVMAEETPYVIGKTLPDGTSGDPAMHTARGTLLGIQASVKYRLKRNDLEGLHIVIRGVGNVGYQLAKLLHARGVQLTIADINDEVITRCVDEFAVQVVAPKNVHRIECDVFSPCALGNIIDETTINEFNTHIIAGCANNQLASFSYAHLLQMKDIVYAPDYVINAGGLIFAANLYLGKSVDEIDGEIDQIYDRLLAIYEQAHAEKRSTHSVAHQLALSKL